ncbi:LytTR family transcriptional regulator DNA-binding domain-containing protein [Spirosoma areae]
MDTKLIKLPGLKLTLPSSDIRYLAGYGNYTWVYLANGRRGLSSQCLSRFALLLPGFIRIHKQYLINPAHMLTLQRTGPYSAVVLMRDRTTFPVSRRRIETVQGVLQLSRQSD